MTRVTYSRSSTNKNVILSNKFLVSATSIIFAAINTDTFMYSILDQNLSVLHQGQCSSLRQCKTNARAKIIELGGKLYDEIRTRKADRHSATD